MCVYTSLQLTIYHLLKLFQNDPAVVAGKKNVVSEQYDELVFTDPTNTMYHLLTSPKPMVPAIRHEPGIDCKQILQGFERFNGVGCPYLKE